MIIGDNRRPLTLQSASRVTGAVLSELMITRYLSWQKLLQIIQTEDPATPNAYQDSSVLYRSNWRARGQVQSWLSQSISIRQWSWQKLLQIIQIEDPATSNAPQGSSFFFRSDWRATGQVQSWLTRYLPWHKQLQIIQIGNPAIPNTYQIPQSSTDPMREHKDRFSLDYQNQYL